MDIGTEQHCDSVKVHRQQEVIRVIHVFVTSRLDYCNALLSGYLDKALNKLQLVLNTAARILTILTRKM